MSSSKKNETSLIVPMFGEAVTLAVLSASVYFLTFKAFASYLAAFGSEQFAIVFGIPQMLQIASGVAFQSVGLILITFAIIGLFYRRWIYSLLFSNIFTVLFLVCFVLTFWVTGFTWKSISALAGLVISCFATWCWASLKKQRSQSYENFYDDLAEKQIAKTDYSNNPFTNFFNSKTMSIVFVSFICFFCVLPALGSFLGTSIANQQRDFLIITSEEGRYIVVAQSNDNFFLVKLAIDQQEVPKIDSKDVQFKILSHREFNGKLTRFKDGVATLDTTPNWIDLNEFTSQIRQTQSSVK